MKEISFEEFESEFKSGKSVFSFGASWCKDCIKAKPMLEALESEYGDVKFYEVDVDRDEKIREKMNIRHIPTILFVNGGVEVYERVVEPNSKEMIENGVKKILE